MGSYLPLHLTKVAKNLNRDLIIKSQPSEGRIEKNLAKKKHIPHLRKQDQERFITEFKAKFKPLNDITIVLPVKKPENGYAIFDWLAEYYIEEFPIQGELFYDNQYLFSIYLTVEASIFFKIKLDRAENQFQRPASSLQTNRNITLSQLDLF